MGGRDVKAAVTSSGLPRPLRIRGKKQPLSSAGLHALRDEHTRNLESTRAHAVEALVLERKLKAEG
jgi:hypothetical protein